MPLHRLSGGVCSLSIWAAAISAIVLSHWRYVTLIASNHKFAIAWADSFRLCWSLIMTPVKCSSAIHSPLLLLITQTVLCTPFLMLHQVCNLDCTSGNKLWSAFCRLSVLPVKFSVFFRQRTKNYVCFFSWIVTFRFHCRVLLWRKPLCSHCSSLMCLSKGHYCFFLWLISSFVLARSTAGKWVLVSAQWDVY